MSNQDNSRRSHRLVATSTPQRENIMLKLKINGGWWHFKEALEKLEPFKTHGSLYGEAGPCIFTTPGRLDQRYWQSLRSPLVDYVVYSYATPIAWHHEYQGWTMPNESYSVSTSKQQGRIRTAISQLGKML